MLDRAVHSAVVTTILSAPAPALPDTPPPGPLGPSALHPPLSLSASLTAAGPARPTASSAGARWRRRVAAMVRAGDAIARRPYQWAGGHGTFQSRGYDCSGSVSYVLHAAGLLSTPEDSSQLMSYGQSGPGRHITVYSNPQHAMIVIAGRRFDTIALQQTGTRWSPTRGSIAGYVARHPRGL